MKTHDLALIAVAVMLVSACAGGSSSTPAEAPLPEAPRARAAGVQVGSVEVVRGSEMPEGDHTAQFEKYDCAARLRKAILAVLESAGRYSEGGELALRVVATDFRLRTGASAFWVGGMAGADFYDVRVEVRQKGGEQLRSFETNTSTILGGMAYASPTKRSQRLIDTLAKRVVAGL